MGEAITYRPLWAYYLCVTNSSAKHMTNPTLYVVQLGGRIVCSGWGLCWSLSAWVSEWRASDCVSVSERGWPHCQLSTETVGLRYLQKQFVCVTYWHINVQIKLIGFYIIIVIISINNNNNITIIIFSDLIQLYFSFWGCMSTWTFLAFTHTDAECPNMSSLAWGGLQRITFTEYVYERNRPFPGRETRPPDWPVIPWHGAPERSAEVK